MEKTYLTFEVDPESLIRIDDLCKYFSVSRKTMCSKIFLRGLNSMFRFTVSGPKINL